MCWREDGDGVCKLRGSSPKLKPLCRVSAKGGSHTAGGAPQPLPAITCSEIPCARPTLLHLVNWMLGDPGKQQARRETLIFPLALLPKGPPSSHKCLGSRPRLPGCPHDPLELGSRAP